MKQKISTTSINIYIYIYIYIEREREVIEIYQNILSKLAKSIVCNITVGT